MEMIRNYLLSVTAAALFCGILSALTGEKGSLSKLNRLLWGLFLTFTLISPLTKVQIPDPDGMLDEIFTEGDQAAQAGESLYNKTMRQIITDETRAYIMDKARSYGAEIQVEIFLSEEDPPVPESCSISGALSPFVRGQLERVLVEDLGIPKEKHQWLQ